MGGLIGGEAKRLSLHEAAGMHRGGKVLHKAMTRAMAVLETNASMGLIVAAPTAGLCLDRKIGLLPCPSRMYMDIPMKLMIQGAL